MKNFHDAVLHSELMNREMPYRVLLPPDYEFSAQEFPVLYLLHGLFGSYENWTTMADLVSYGSQHQLIIVMPEGENGWYTDGCGAEDKYESFLIKELIPAVDERLRTIKSGTGRGIAGLSMGGYGAVKSGLKHPDMFGFAASVSGAFDVTHWSDETPTADWETFGPPIMRIFGDAGSQVRRENDLTRLIQEMSRTEIASLPYLYLDCGIDDAFVAANRRLSSQMAEAGIEHEFYVLNGGHDWDYWDKRGRFLLELAAEQLTGSTYDSLIGVTNSTALAS